VPRRRRCPPPDRWRDRERRERRSGLKQAFTVVLLRDWHPVLRDPLDLFRLSFPIGARIFAVQGDWDAAVRLFLPGLAVFAVRAIDGRLPRPLRLHRSPRMHGVGQQP
jgi:hypothetical protein